MGEAGEDGWRLGDRRGAGGIAGVETVGVDELDVGDANEPLDGAEAGLEGVIGSAGGQKSLPLATVMTARLFFASPSTPPELRVMVRPRRTIWSIHAVSAAGRERVNWSGDHELIGGEELDDIAVGNGDGLASGGRRGVGQGKGALDPCFGLEGRWLMSNDADDVLAGRVGGTPCGEKLLAELSAVGAGAAWAGVDLQQRRAAGGV